ncbi:hypothetical protein K490DRAFT_49343 [Saccharata proteae CBS 121410]|uniref:Glycosyltransferase 2-like domain-containing protein n=1 Tax=Saccharata proteae CBS 121410 TaxID=1314787 RepID=A0A9P4HRP3_9PEZI|nr:hypothetical protein K490DRAFT_49343 [Saccharata proteae CBS 121410]
MPSRDTRFVYDIRHEVIVNFLHQKQCSSMWIEDTSGAVEGVVVRKGRGDYICCPPTLLASPMVQALSALNVQSAMTVKSRVVSTFLARVTDGAEIPISNGLRVQVVSGVLDLVRARKHQYAAFVASEALLVVWDDDPSNLVRRVEAIEADLVKIVWEASKDGPKFVGVEEKEVDLEEGITSSTQRRTVYLNSFYTGVSVAIAVCLMGLGGSRILTEVVLTGNYLSIGLLALTPILILFCLFFCNVVVSIVAQILGPIQQLNHNSKFYSAVCMPRLQGTTLPHITIQCPVYKEGLEGVIRPTVKSLKQAISTYELQGGTANILINDDGLQLLDEEERHARIEFYNDNNIGWTARPKHDPAAGFIRRGKFKKASNLNYGLRLSNMVEERLRKLLRHEKWSVQDETNSYESILQDVLKEDPRAWAQGNIRIGDYILLIDSDTRVPIDCLLDAASEMEASPDVAILQFSSGVMQVVGDFFENAITFFTNMVYTAIRYGVAAGDVAPFVGHNAVLRWEAIQQVSFLDEEGTERFWSETSVSEDFDMALRLQVEGYTVRLAGWADDEFKEGVSLTVYDELSRWEKYAYGCSELVFNPLKDWIFRGPFTPLFRHFITSSMPLGSKINIIAYVGTYFAIASSWISVLVNYVLVGLCDGELDKWYTEAESWRVWVSLMVVFVAGGNIAVAVQRHRAGVKAFLPALIESIKWSILFSIFFGGLSMHLSQAILSHMFSIDMSWGATAKEVEKSNFFKEVPKIAKKFKYSMIFCILEIIGIVIMATADFIPWSWNITSFPAIFPLALLASCHLLVPVALNPNLMTFSW